MASLDLLPADTAMGAVTLLVSDLDTETRFYRDAVGLDVVTSDGHTISLGRGGRTLVHLEYAPDLSAPALGSAGLFHTAILFETRAALAAAVYSTATVAPASFTGSADHLVSQAFYFTDPEGNGVELYWDRDRTEWSWVHGQVEMATLALDPNAFIHEHIQLEGTADAAAPVSPGDAEVGHVHLSVGDISAAREFYVDRLGFETTATISGQALFVSAGGYHHHMAMNTWNSRGAAPRTRALGLGAVDIVLASPDDVGALSDRMTHFGVAPDDDGRAITFADPWNNTIRVTSTG